MTEEQRKLFVLARRTLDLVAGTSLDDKQVWEAIQDHARRISGLITDEFGAGQ
jgi:hypothetical protein